MIGDGSGVANMRSVRRWSAVLALAGTVAASSAAPAQTPVPMEFPPPGTRWITRTIDRSGGSHLTTYTVLEPGAFRGQPAFRVSDAVGAQFYERAGRNWFASVVREKERTGSTPAHRHVCVAARGGQDVDLDLPATATTSATTASTT